MLEIVMDFINAVMPDQHLSLATLVLVGHNDSLKILKDYPCAELAILDQAGHNLQIEQKRIFNNPVNEWLGRVEEPSAYAFQEQGERKP
jgi:pimeloyl-ACP methyl ester carboxylesterase